MTTNYDNFDALPIEVVNSEMTDSQLKVMEILFVYNGLDKTYKNGYFYISNADLMKEAGIGSKTTLTKVISFFITNNFIERKSGKLANRTASEYKLNVDEVIRWSKAHPSNNTLYSNSSMGNNKQLERIVANAMAPILAHQQELIKIINELRDEITMLKSCLASKPTGTLLIKECTTDIDTQYKRLYKCTESTDIRQDAVNTIITQQAPKANSFEIILTELKQSVEEFKRIPSWESKKVINGIIERIKALHQQGGCTSKQLKLAYAIQKDINGIPLPRGSVASQAGKVPNTSTSVPSSFFSTSSPQVDNTISNRKPTDDDIHTIETLVAQSNYFKQSIYDALITQLKPLDDTTKGYYINRYIHSIYPEIDEDVIALKKDTYKRLNLQYPDYTSSDFHFENTFRPSLARFQVGGAFGL